jgi:hypothetical protein
MRRWLTSAHVRLGIRAAMWLFMAGWLTFTANHPSAVAISVAATAFLLLALSDIGAAGQARREKWEAEAREADLTDSAAKEAELKAAQARAAAELS